jgi:hypothetical protein
MLTVLATSLRLVSFLAYASTLKMDATISSETPVDFNGLHGAISYQTEIFISAAGFMSKHYKREGESHVAFSFDGTLRTKRHRQGFRHVPTHNK